MAVGVGVGSVVVVGLGGMLDEEGGADQLVVQV